MRNTFSHPLKSPNYSCLTTEGLTFHFSSSLESQTVILLIFYRRIPRRCIEAINALATFPQSLNGPKKAHRYAPNKTQRKTYHDIIFFARPNWNLAISLPSSN